MRHQNKLLVQPLHRYAHPQYPSYRDPNPLGDRLGLPFPFSRKVLELALASGLIAGPLAAEEPSSPEGPTNRPFRFESLGVPFTPASFGTGLPSRLEEREVRGLIETVFRSEGINARPGFLWRGSSGTALLDGYDADAKVGYVILRNRMGTGFVSNDPHFSRLEQYLRTREYVGDLESYIEQLFRESLADFNSKKMLTKFIGDYLHDSNLWWEPRRKTYVNMIQKLDPMGNPLSSLDKDLFVDMVIEKVFFFNEKFYIPEVLLLAEKVTRPRDPQSRGKALTELYEHSRKGGIIQLWEPHRGVRLAKAAYQLARSSDRSDMSERLKAMRRAAAIMGQLPPELDSPLTTFVLKAPIEVVRSRIEVLADIASPIKRSLWATPDKEKAVVQLVPLLKRALRPDAPPSAWDDLIRGAPKADPKRDKELVSLYELREMLDDADRKRHYILPITFHENLTIVEAENPPERLLGQEEFDRRQRDWEDAKSKSLRRLEKEILRYLEWARAQGHL